MNWLKFFRETAPALGPALANPGQHVPCPLPGHSTSKDGFRLFGDFYRTGGGVCNTCGSFPTGVRLLAALKGGTQQEAEKYIHDWVKAHPSEVAEVVTTDQFEDTRAERYRRLANLLRSALPVVPGSPVWLYLRNRGLTLDPPPALQYLPMQDCWGSGPQRSTLLGRFPAMLATIRNPAGHVVSIHRTFLTLDGQKAPVPVVKKLSPGLERLSGSAIPLLTRRDNPVLHVAEGIETTLAIREIVGDHGSFWAAGNAGLLETMVLPNWAREVHIWADRDPSLKSKTGAEQGKRGEKAASACYARWKTKAQVFVHLAPADPAKPDAAQDWLDTLLRCGSESLQQQYSKWLLAQS